MARLRILSGRQEGRTLYVRPPGPFVFGRSLDSNFPLIDPLVSRRHFRLEFTTGAYRVVDLGSKSGTRVDGVAVDRANIEIGARLTAGDCELELCAEPDPLNGRELGGYRILERVGRGGMGTVYRARQTSLQRVVAIKVLAERFSRDSSFSAKFVEEAKRAAELSHPNIVRVYDVNRLDGLLFYAMEYTSRGSLEDRLRRDGSLSAKDAVDVIRQAAAGLAYAEKAGVVHRDIKPANLMVDGTGTVKIGDLGIATRAGAAPSVRSGAPPQDAGAPVEPGGLSGSPPYMSPEQILNRPVDHRGDLYSLGICLYELLSGAPPFRGSSVKEILYAHIRDRVPDLSSLRPELPAVLTALASKLLEKRPEDRPESAARLIESLDAVAESLGNDAKPRPLGEFAPRLVHAALFIVGVAAGALIAWALID